MMRVFAEQKRRAIERLRDKGADDEVAEVLQKINRLDDFFTTSSCSGRIALIHLPEIGAKREARFIGKWHGPVTTDEVLGAIRSAPPSRNGEVWFIAQSPIVHVACRSLERATVMLRIAIESGFKYSGIKALTKRNGRVIVELMSTERMDVPLVTDDRMLCSEAHLDFIVAKANLMLLRSKAKLKRLALQLSELEEMHSR